MTEGIIFEDNRLLKYLIRNYYNSIYSAIEKYFNNPDYDILDIDFRHTVLETMPQLSVKGYISANVFYCVPYREDCNEIYLYIQFSFEMNDISSTFRILDINDEKYEIECYCKNNFISMISNENLKRIANNLLEEFYWDYNEEGYINSIKLANNMGLCVKYGKISKDSSIFGLICMNDTQVSLYDNEGNLISVENEKMGTIYIDRNANYLYAGNEYKENYTIVHECIHWYLHRKYFMFINMINNSKIDDYKCNNSIVCFDNEDLMWIERQANAISSLVLLPEELLLPRYFSLYEKNHNIYSDNAIAMELSILELSDFFKVSKEAIKIRLSELGISVVGIFEHVDGRYLKSYTYKQGFLSDYQSFSIGYDCITTLFMKNKELFNALKKQELVIVENHIVKNDKKYLLFNDKGLNMTSYALNNMDECAIPFTYTVESFKNDNYLYRDYILCRLLTDDYSIDADININGLDVKSNSSVLIEINEKALKIYKNMPKDFGDALKYLLDCFELKITDLEVYSNVYRETLSRYINHSGGKPSRENVIAICVGLSLPPILSNELLRITNNEFSSDAIDGCIKTLLDTFYYLNYYDFNEMYKKYTKKDLVKKKNNKKRD